MSTSLVPFGTRSGTFYNFRKEMDHLFDRFFTGENDGVLQVHVPKAEKAQTKKIEIKA